jgi:hypothetical protein
MEKFDHNIGFEEKRQFFWRKCRLHETNGLAISRSVSPKVIHEFMVEKAALMTNQCAFFKQQPYVYPICIRYHDP